MFVFRKTKIVGNKAKGRISNRVFQGKKVRQIFWKINMSYPLIRIRTFFGKFDVHWFLGKPVWDSPFCLITDEVTFDDGKSWKLSEDVNLLWELCALPWDTDIWIKTASHVKTLLYGKNPMQLFGNDKSFNLMKLSKAALKRCSYKKVFWKYTANLQENTHAEVWFQYS